MRLSLVGINHQTAPISIREQVAISTEQLPSFLSHLRTYTPQGIILSTCNRTEVYTADKDIDHAKEASLNFFKIHLKITDTQIRRYVYVNQNETAIKYLFRVAAGLESMIVGEYEVLGQVRHALEVAEMAKMVNLPLRHLFQSALRCGRRVREETGISQNALSVSSVAIELAAKVIGNLKSSKMLVIGTGEAGRLVVKIAKERGISRIVVASRAQERAEALASTMIGGSPISLREVTKELNSTNIVVTCAGAPYRILATAQVAEVMRERPELPLMIIDIAVPRNVEPAVREIKNVFLYNIDDLTDIADVNRKQRESEVQKVMEIVTAEVEKLLSWWQALEIRPVVSALMSKAEEIRRQQLGKTMKKLPPLSTEEQDYLEAMTKSIVTKILEEPIRHLKARTDGHYAEIVGELFGLNPENRP